MPKNRTYTVCLEVPTGATNTDIIQYITESVQTWRGQLRPPGAYGDDDPGDVMWGLNAETVKVTRAKI